jgi:hypothetical protein
MGKKKRLMDIGRPRHDEFDAQLRRRFKGQTGIEPRVNEIEKQGIDAAVEKGKQVKEAIELTNYDLFHFPNDAAISHIKKKQQASVQRKLQSFKSGKIKKPRTLCYTGVFPLSIFPPLLSSNVFPNKTMLDYMKCKVSKENRDHQIRNLKKYPHAKKYVVFSHGENLTEQDLWAYAQEGIKVKIARYQAKESDFDAKIGRMFFKYWYCPTCGRKLDFKGLCRECGYSVDEDENDILKFEVHLKETEEIQNDEDCDLWAE